MSTSEKKSNIIFLKVCVIGLLFLGIIVFLNALLYSRIALAVAALGNKLEAACGCTNHWSFSSHPWLFTSLILASLVLAAFIGFTLAKVIRLKMKTSRFIRANLENRKVNLSGKLKHIVHSLNLHNKVIEIKDSNPVVFCFGIIHPKICISSAFVKKLNQQELRAVLLHEQHHLSSHEIVKLFIIKTIATVLFFVPGVKSLAQQYSTFSEISADEWAISNSQDKMPLAGAMYKILELKEHFNVANNVAIASFSYVTEERINKMTDDNYVIKINIIKPRLLMNLFLLSGVLFMFAFFIYSSKVAIANHDDNLCAAGHTNEHHSCEMLNDGSICKMHDQDVLSDHSDCGKGNYNSSPYNGLTVPF